jgi:hypothetical protein
VALTEAQLRSKREEFWDTAPAFEGKTEIWAALKAAVDAATKEDQALAQAILDGAGISLPGGSLVECYDELGTRYSIPVYCLSLPVNLLVEGAGDRDSPAEFSEPVELEEGVELKVRVRVSLTGEDVRLVINSRETVAQVFCFIGCMEQLDFLGKEKAPRAGGGWRAWNPALVLWRKAVR